MIDTILLADYSLATVFGWTILHSLWQIALIAFGLKLLLFWTSKSAATIRYCLSLFALLLAIIWSAHTFSLEWEKYHFEANTIADSTSNDVLPTLISTGELEQTFFVSFEENTRLLTQYVEPVMPYLAVFWLIGMLFFASKIIVGLFQLHTFSKKGTQVLPNHWQIRFESLKQLSGIGRKVEVRLSELVPVPITYQFFRPIILLPISVFTGLSHEQIEVLLLHELAHIKRHDYVVNLLQSVVEVLFFYHPFIWWISKNVRAEREYCCDDEVMKLRHQPMLYAQTLTQIQSQHYSHKTNLAMSINGNKGEFSQRIYRLFQQQTPHSNFRNAATALLLLFFCGMTMAFYPNSNQSKPKADVEINEVKNDTVPKITLTEKELEGKKRMVEEITETVRSTKIDENTTVIEVTSVYKEVEVPDNTIEEKSSNLEEESEKGISSKKPKTTYTVETDEGDKVDVSVAENEELFTVKTLKGKKPTIVLDGEPITDSEIDEEGKLVLNIPSEEIKSVNVYKGEKAKEKFGNDNPDGVIEIFSHKNDEIKGMNVSKGAKIILKSDKKKAEQPLFVIDGEKSYSDAPVKKLSPDDILTINVLKGDSAFEKYGADGANGVVEIITKGTQPQKKHFRKKQNRKKGERKTKNRAIGERKKMKSAKAEKTPKVNKSPSLSVFPNPTDNIINIEVEVKEKGLVKVDVYNQFGQLIESPVNQTLEAGTHQFQWEAENQPSGSYFVHFDMDGEFITKQVFVKK